MDNNQQQAQSTQVLTWEQQNQYLAQRGISESVWSVLCNTLYPSNKPESVILAWDYCEARDLDIMMKPIHLVPMQVKNPVSGNKEWRDVPMPGVGLYRIQASRSGDYAGADEPEFGPVIEATFTDAYNANNQITVRYPEWCKYTVHKMIGDRIVAFSAKEYWLENYATMKAASDCPNAMWKKRPHGQLAKCFDEQTEVLTEKGFIKFSEVDCKILQVTDSGLSAVKATPFSQDYGGMMIESNGTRLNFSVTPNHDMITSHGKMEASDLFDIATTDASKIAIPRAPSNSSQDYDISDNALRLAGYYLADGSHTGYRQFRIAVSRENKIEKLTFLDCHESIRIKKDAGRTSYIDGRKVTTTKDKQSFSYSFSLIEALVSPDKSINIDACLKLSQRQARIVVDALVEFDGSTNQQGVRRLTQNNVKVIASFEVLSQIACYSIGKPTVKESAFTFTISSKDDFCVVKGVAKNKSSLVQQKNTTSKVWCVTVPSGKIVVRRDGFSMVCGNCAEAQALRKAWPEVGQEPTAEEMEGKERFIDERDITPSSSSPAINDGSFRTEVITKGIKAIESGKKTPEQVIAFAESKGIQFSTEELQTLHSIKVAA